MENVIEKDDDLLYEDDEPKSEKLRFKDILDVSFIRMYFYQTSKYFSQINCHIETPIFIYYIHIVLTFIQLASPCFILNSNVIWNSDSISTLVFQIIFAVSRGWYSDNDDYPRRIITIVCIFVFLICNIILEFLKHRFQDRQIVSNSESSIVISIYKYIIPHFYPFLLCGIPGAIKSLINGHHSFLNYFDVIVGLLFFIYEMIKYFDLTKRVLFEKNPSFSLNSLFLPFTILTISINNLIDCLIISPEKSIYQIFLLAVMLIIYIFNGIVYVFFIPNISPNYSNLYSSVCLSSSLVIILDFICIYMNISISIFLFFVFLVSTIIIFIINILITRKSSIKYAYILDEMENFPDLEKEYFDSLFRNKYHFFRAMFISFSSWSPYFFSWKPFHFAVEKWPESKFILIFWAKIVSIIPGESALFDQLTVKILQNHKIPLTYRLQFRYIMHTRITNIIPSLRAFFVSFDKASLHTKSMCKLFFEDILAKNAPIFWKNVADISQQVKKLDFAIQKNIDAYPNNVEVVSYYCRFLETIKLDLEAADEWKQKLEHLKSGEKLKNDLPFSAALPIYPQLSELGSKTQEFTPNYISNSENDDKETNQNEEKEEDDSKLKLNLAMMIKKSRTGEITSTLVTIIVGTVGVIICFACFIYLYLNNYIYFFDDALFDINNIDNSILCCSRLEFFAGQLVTLFGSKVDRKTILPKMAPSLVRGPNSIPAWTFGIEDMISMAEQAREYIKELPEYFDNFMKKSSLLFEGSTYHDLFETEAHSLLLDSIDDLVALLLESPLKLLDSDPVYTRFVTRMNDFFPKLISASDKLTSYSSYESLEKMNNLMVLGLLFNMFLISVPYILCFFSLGTLSHDISQSFLSLQVSTVSEVISKLASSTTINSSRTRPASPVSKPEEANLCKVIPTHQGRNYASTTLYIFIFILTFVPIFIPFFFVYYYVQYFSENCAYELRALQDMTYPVSLIYYISYLYTEVYNTKFVYTSNFPMSTDFFISRGKYFINYENQILKNGLFDKHESLHIIMKNAPNDLLFETHRIEVLTELESLIKSSFLGSINLISSTIFVELNKTAEMEIDDFIFYQFSYFLTNWAIEERDTPFFNSLFDSISHRIQRNFTYIIPLCICFSAFQVLVVFFAIISLRSNLKYFTSAMNFFLLFKPSLILQNDYIMKMICKDHKRNEGSRISFKNSEKILVNIPEAVVILDKNLCIVDHNKAFNKLLTVNEPLIGNHLTKFMLYRKCSSFNIDHLERRLNSVLRGKDDPNFNLSFSFLTVEKKPLFVNATVVSLSQKGAVNNESQYKQITMIALVIDDQTSNALQAEKIANEQKKIEKVLEKVMPLPIVSEVQESNESVAFSVQSVTIGNIIVEAEQFNEADGIDAPFIFYEKIFSLFDECLKSHPMVTKTRAFMKIYTFSCGLFEEQVKPEKMAEEATRFALSIFQMQPKIEDKIKRRITLRIGLDSGGPVVAGFVSLNRPNFMVVGNVADMALSMALTGIPGKVQISQNVQELIYLYSFNIQERGETRAINGARTKTFFVAT